MKRTIIAATLLAIPSMLAAQSGTASVSGLNATYLAGGNTYTTAPGCAIGGCSSPGGIAPIAITLNAGFNRILTFSVVDGTMTFCGGATCGTPNPDGPAATLPTTNLTPSGRISGISAPTSGFLAGVFIGGSLPASAPASLDFNTGAGIDFLSLSPLLGQQFFIGNGRTSGNVIQQFLIPDAATVLYLGIADGFGFQGNPGAYDDNVGTYRATYSITTSTVPEPSTVVLVATGLLAAALVRRRRC